MNKVSTLCARYLLSALFMSYAQAACATPARFNLACKSITGASSDALNVRFIVDTDASVWCSDKCVTKNFIVANNDEALTLFSVEASAEVPYTKHVIYNLVAHTLSNETIIASMKNITRYACHEEAFTGFTSDKSQDAMILEPLPGPKDYPLGAKRRNESGYVAVVLKISASGRLDSCEVIVSSRSSDLDQGTCQFLIEHGRFRAARDVTGIPIPGEIHKTFNWRM